uniref:Precorrin-6y C5,15-methyltransferase (Decarboxylating) subunit CbiE n=1 Tax=Desulfobacca acetoxidans TaxID=60893 RepID=A0A7C5AMB5_9BACT
MIPVHVVGLGLSPADLTPRAWDLIHRAQVLAGGRRLLAFFPEHPAEKVVLGKKPEETLNHLAELAQVRQVVILASGDPNFYGIGPLAVKVLGPENVVIHPNLTAVQAAASRLKLAWHQIPVVSLHGRSWEALKHALRESRQLFIYTDPAHTPAGISQKLREWGVAGCRLCVLEDLGLENERVSWLTLEEAVSGSFSPLNLVFLDTIGASRWGGPASTLAAKPVLRLGMPEEAFSPEAGLITKTEIRAVVLAKLELAFGQVLWDVGAGSGSVGLEASLLLGGGTIFAVEKDPERAAQIAANCDKFQVQNLRVICGKAPDCLRSLPTPDRVFVGGGGEGAGEILRVVLGRLKPGGKVVLTATRLETLEKVRGILHQEAGGAEVVQLQVSRSQPLAGGSYLKALNPVWLIGARKAGSDE